MKISLLDVKSPHNYTLNRDVMGGYGEGCTIGCGRRARLIARAKSRGVVIPSLSYAYMAAILAQNGFEVEVSDAELPKADIVIIHSSLVAHHEEKAAAMKIKRQTGARVGFIGPLASADPQAFLDAADFVIRGEPETACLSTKDSWQPEGIIDSPQVDNLDALPVPKWDLFDVGRFSYSPSIRARPFLPIVSSRGCAFSCDYCPYLAFSGTWRHRSPENVLAEIEHMVGRFGVKGMLFRDPLFTANKERAAAIARGIAERGLAIRWACESRIDCLDETLIDTMYDGGMRAINIGVESVCGSVLDGVHRKRTDRQREQQLIRYLDRKKVNVSAFYVLGLPTDSEESILETIDYAKRLNTNVAQFFIATPFPGTRFHERVKDRLITTDYARFDCFTPTFRHDRISAEKLLDLKEHAFVSYYFRIGYLLRFIQRTRWG